MSLAFRWRGGLQCAGLVTAACFGGLVLAQPGKLLLTGGVSGVDGAAGGGLTPWAVIGGPATDEHWGATAFVSTASTQGYRLQVQGLAVGWRDRLEVSLARQDLATGSSLAPLGLTGFAPASGHPGPEAAGGRRRRAGRR